MPEGQVLEFSGVTKRFGAVTAVDGLTARVEPGRVTGFLGPNGAGKTTTLRILLGLVKATSGSATIGGSTYAHLRHPLQTVGAVLEASSFHAGRTGAAHLKVYAQAAGIPTSRVQEALGMVGLADVGGRKVGGYSLGMRQRLGLAYALLGDPGVLVLDEPANGLDPEGIKWMRGLLRELARQGRTVLVSSHLLAEVQQTVDSLLIISRGKLVFQGPLSHLTDADEYATVVDSPDRAALTDALRAGGVDFEVLRSGLTVRGVDTALVGTLAAASGVALSSLQRRGPALEEVFLDLVNGTRVHPSATGEVAPEAVAEEPVVEPAAEESVAEDAAAEDAAAEEPVADEPAPVGEAAIAAVAVAAATDDVTPDAALANDAPDVGEGAAAPAGFVVAATGVVDIVPTEDDEATDAEGEGAGESTDAEPGAEDWSQQAEEPQSEPDSSEPEPSEPAPSEPAPSEPAAPEEDSDESAAIEDEEFAAPAESLADVGDEPEADAAGDDSPSEEPAPEQDPAESAPEESADTGPSDPDPADGSGGGDDADDRPWEDRAKTESDVEADAFFSMFDDGEGPSEQSPSDEPQGDEPQGEEPPSEAEPAASESPEPPAEYNEPDETPDGQDGDSGDESDAGEPEREADAHEEGEQR